MLTPDMGIKILSTGIRGPLPPQTHGFIIGKASAVADGLIVYPGAIDQNYSGEFKVIASSTRGISFVPASEKIAQLILIPVSTKTAVGSAGTPEIFWTQPITSDKPYLNLYIEGKLFKGLVDTGADVSIIRAHSWPSSWSLTETITHLQGIGYASNPRRSSKLLNWNDGRGNSGFFQPYVLPNLPVTLWGRDLLSQMELILCSLKELNSRLQPKQDSDTYRGHKPHMEDRNLTHFR